MTKNLIILSLFLLTLQSIVAQNPFITNYTIADGLPSNKVFCTYQDKNDFMWFGTDAGVVRFDGSNFVSYTKEDGLSDDLVVRIKEDFEGRLWFLNFNGTINYLYNNIIYNEKNAPFLDELKTNYFIYNFFQDKDSTLFFYNMLSEVFVVKNNKMVDYKHFNFNNRDDIGLLHLNKSLHNKILLWTMPGIYETEDIDDVVELNKLPVLSQKVFEKSKNEKFILDRTGFLHQSKNSKIVKREILRTTTLLVNSILEDKDNYIWISTFDKGIYCYRGDSMVLHVSIDKAQNLVLDNENNIWAVSNIDGIYKINRDILKYKFIGAKSFDGEGITDLANSNQNGVWATNGKSLFYITNKHRYSRKLPLGENILNNIYQLKNNTIILNGTGTNMLVIDNVSVNPEKNIIEHGSQKKLNFRIKKIAVDTTENYLYSYANDQLIITDLKNSLKSSFLRFKRGRINNVFINNKNELIVNAAKNYTLKDSIYIDPIFKPYNGEIISSHLILDAENELFNIIKNRLYLLNNEKFYDLIGQFKSEIDYRIKDMVYDGSTLFFFTIKTVYFISNPLKILSGEPLELNRLNIEFNNINDLFCKDSTLYVASNDGLMFIPVEECVDTDAKPTKPYINKVVLNDKNYDFSEGVVKFKKQERMSIEFSSLNYSSIPSSYLYMLEGVDETWISGNEKRVVYLNLAPGSYTFKLKSRKNREQYSRVVELPIVVAPTLLQRPPIKLLLLLILLFIVFLIIRSFYRRKIKQQETEHLLTTLENKALQSMMNPHFIFNALGSIQGFLLQNRSIEASAYLSQFARLIRQNMNSLKSNYICIDEEVERLRNYIDLEKLRLNNKFSYNIEVDDQIDSYEVRIPSMIVQPFVENAIWHGISSIEGEGLINVIFKYLDTKSIVVLVEDNGIGIQDADTLSKSGHGLNMGIALTKKRLKIMGKQSGVNCEITTKNLNDGTTQPGTQIKIIVPVV